MSQIQLVVVTYRDVFQWAAKLKGDMSEYQLLSKFISISESDLEDLGIADGAEVKLSNAAGSIVVQARLEQDGSKGFGYMPSSQYSNMLVSYDLNKAGSPGFKRIEVWVEPIDG